MGPRHTYFHRIFWLSLSVLGGATHCGDSGGPMQSLSDSDGGTSPMVCDVVRPTACTRPEVSFKKDVKPIIDDRCGSCHDGRGEQWPLVDFAHVADWASEVRAMISDCSMPPPDSGIVMPTSERDTILQWVRCGTPD